MSEITIVTGLPRSGTSLMMQIIHKAGIDILSDGIRKSDVSNPEGYYEYEPVKRIVKDNGFLKEAVGKAVKIVAPLPVFMDTSLSYKVIFMRREMEEVLRSQEKMLQKDQSAERDKFRMIFQGHLDKTYQFFELNTIPYLDVQYNNLVKDPSKVIPTIKDFLGLQAPLDELLQVVKPDLYRNQL